MEPTFNSLIEFFTIFLSISKTPKIFYQKKSVESLFKQGLIYFNNLFTAW